MHTFKRAVTMILSLGFLLASAMAADKTVVLGGEAGWPALSYSAGLSRAPGHLGQKALILSSAVSRVDAADLYLSFDSSTAAEDTGNYAVASSVLRQVGEKKARRGTGAALCDTDGTGLALKGNPGSLFSTPGNTGSFSIEFWLFPAVTENGSVLLQWRSSRIVSSEARYQNISAGLFMNHLEWTFFGLWTTSSGKPLDVTVKGRKNLIPGTWSHHELSYDAVTGLLTYSLDGSAEDIRYMTSSGREQGDVYPALIGAPAVLEIAPRYSGLIDEVRIVRNPVDRESIGQKHAVIERYSPDGGRFESMPIDSKALNSTLKSISVIQSLPAETGTAFYVRSGDNFYQWTDVWPEWIPANPDEILSGVSGRYFQVAGELYPDGRGARTPTVTSVALNYDEDSPPWPPAKVFTSPGNGAVTLTWVASIDFDVAGYIVYYGDRPGEYLASGSPMNVGKALSCTIPDLKNGKVYYFCIAAYDASGAKYPGTLSGEVYERPRAARTAAAIGADASQ